jgi:hypothetical protein
MSINQSHRVLSSSLVQRIFPNHENIPVEIAMIIFSQLDLTSYTRASQVCKNWWLIIEDPRMWSLVAKSLNFQPDSDSCETIKNQIKTKILEDKFNIYTIRDKMHLEETLRKIYLKINIKESIGILFTSQKNPDSTICIVIGNDASLKNREDLNINDFDILYNNTKCKFKLIGHKDESISSEKVSRRIPFVYKREGPFMEEREYSLRDLYVSVFIKNMQPDVENSG